MPPYEYVRRARSFGRVAPSRMTRGTKAAHKPSLPLRGWGTNTLLNSGQNTVLLAKLCRKTKSVLIGAQPILSITVKFHARRMRGSPPALVNGFLNNRRTAPPTAIRHPERSEVLLRERKRADANPRSDSDDGIYEGAFVTFQRQSYFPTNTGRRGRRPLRMRATTENSPPSVEGGGEPASRRESFKTKVSFPCNLSHQTSKIQINIVYFAPVVAF